MFWWTLQQLKSSKPEARAHAAKKLGSAGKKRAVRPLINCLQDEDRQVRLAVIEALAVIAHPASADPLSSALEHLSGKRSGSREDRTAEYEALAKALARVGEPAVTPLTALLASHDKDTRRWATVALGLIKSSKAVSPLIEKLEDGRSDVRKAAAASLGEIGDPTAIAALVKALSSRDMETRQAAAEALGKIQSADAEEALMKAVSDQSEAVQLAAINSLGRIGGLKSAARLRAAAGEPRKAVGRAAEKALKEMSFSPANILEEAELAVIRGDFQSAIQKGLSAVPALIRALALKDPQMRLKAAESLGVLRASEAVHPLISALNDQDRAVQRSSMQALAGIGSPALGPLQESLAHYYATVVQLSAEALGEIGDLRSTPALLTFLESTSVTNEYPEMIGAVRAAVNSLQSMLESSCTKLPEMDLMRMSALPQNFQLSGYQATATVDCTPLRKWAAEELLRRKST
jgi:HEAT repeat protein